MNMRIVIAALSGLIFGLGLLIADMSDPARVLAFLNVKTIATGGWDPTLMFVLGGATTVSALAWRLSHLRTTAIWGGPLPSAPGTTIDARLLGGAALFGIGWGLAGVCPGPALTALLLDPPSTVIFMAAMIAGMALFHVGDKAWRRRARTA